MTTGTLRRARRWDWAKEDAAGQGGVGPVEASDRDVAAGPDRGGCSRAGRGRLGPTTVEGDDEPVMAGGRRLPVGSATRDPEGMEMRGKKKKN